MSSNKKHAVESWDRMAGRRTIYFNQAETLLLEGLAKASGESDQDVIRRLVREVAGGLLIRKESLDAYREVVARFADSRQLPTEIPTYGNEEVESGQQRKVS